MGYSIATLLGMASTKHENEVRADNKNRFIGLLRSTGREGIEYVIEDLENNGFFDAPASCSKRASYPGGLCEHSLNVYDQAIALRETQLRLRPELAAHIPVQSVVIASLLHDICKSDIYRDAHVKGSLRYGENVKIRYGCHLDGFPIGHGEKSVIMLLISGLEMTEDEMLAIRWHMYPWDTPMNGGELSQMADEARRKSPLTVLIASADCLAAKITEGKPSR